MNAVVTWSLVAAVVAAGGLAYGWQGLVLAISIVVFWLLLQFSRSLRALRKAGNAPVGSVASAVMLHSRLNAGMTLVQVLALSRSLGERVEPPSAGAQESWRWRDSGGVSVTVDLRSGRVRAWSLQRPDDIAAP
jgi:hypothetical protein